MAEDLASHGYAVFGIDHPYMGRVAYLDGHDLDGHARRTNGIGKEAASGVTQRSDVIDVQAKANGRRLHRTEAAAASWLALSARLSCWA